jgi:hypothetical protein
MRFDRALVVEAIEERALTAPISIRVAPVSPPIIAAVDPRLDLHLSTDHQVYRRGQPVVITLTETNTSQQEISVADGPSFGGLLATRNGRRVWASNAGIQPMFLVVHTLKPGQSITQTATWYGRSNIGPRAEITGHLLIGSQIEGVRPVSILIRGR